MSLVVWIFAISATLQLQPAVTVEAYREFAAEVQGNTARGKAVFSQKKAGCAGCHSVGDGSLRAGPDLLGIADKYSRDKLITAVLQPGDFILTGYAATTFVTESGMVHSGIIPGVILTKLSCCSPTTGGFSFLSTPSSKKNEAKRR